MEAKEGVVMEGSVCDVLVLFMQRKVERNEGLDDRSTNVMF